MALQLYNTLTRQKSPFQPAQPPHVNLYVCGPTVYDDAHLGHARCYIAWDVLVRTLTLLGYTVRYARNITDVDDKILNRAKEHGKPFLEWAETYTARFHEDMAALNVQPPTEEPKATAHIGAIIEGCQALMANCHAYATDKGNVYYRTSAKADYGKLSQKPLDELKTGVRVAAEDDKESPLDFALWKTVADGTDTDSWAAPWTTQLGRPGWHMECSAMNHALFDSKLDIHAGGADLMFPHHENEIAQSEAWSGHTPFATVWLHNGFVTVDGEKMAKSMGNFATVRDLLQHYPADAIRHFLLTHHYRMPVDFTPEGLQGAANRMGKLHATLRRGAHALGLQADVLACLDTLPSDHPDMAGYVEAISDDLNTPRALAQLDSAFAQLNRILDTDGGAPAIVRQAFLPAWSMYSLLGFSLAGIFEKEALPEGLLPVLQQLAQQYQLAEVPTTPEILIEALLAARQHAKTNKDWATADGLRNGLVEAGLQLQDNKDGSTDWTYQAKTPIHA